jgi:dTDP-4-dehydrorhamnose 3,5-epimerase
MLSADPMDVKTTLIPGVVVIKPSRNVDARGHFVETYNEQAFRTAGIAVSFVQDNLSFSRKRGTVRGLHFQLPPSSQAKLVCVVRGSIFDVAVDLRARSPTYGRWIAKHLTADNGEQIFIPRGLAHGFCTLEPNTEVAYKVDEYYAPECDSGLLWSDPALAIDWPITAEEAVLSDKDRKLGHFSDFMSPFRYDGD